MMRRALIVGANVADQSFDPLGEGVERVENALFPPAAFVASRARLVLHEMYEPLGDILKPLFEALASRAPLDRGARRIRFARGFADRGFQPLADRKAGTARRFPSRGPGVGLHGIDAPGDARGHGRSVQGTRSPRSGER